MLANLTGGNKEERAISFQSIWGAGDSFSASTEAGTSIDQNQAMKINAFYACVLLISDTISTLPVDSFIRLSGDRLPYRPQPSWIQRPDVDLLRSEHYQQVLISMLLDGNAFIRVFRDGSGQVVNLVVIDPYRVRITRNNLTREIEYVIDENKETAIRKQDMIHITEMRKAGELRGMSRVTELKDNLGLSSALQSFASRFFGQGATTSGIIETPQGLNSEQAKTLVDGFNSRHNGFRKAHKTGLLTGGAKFVRTGVNPDEAQMLDSQKFAVEQIARIFRVPPHMIGVTTPGAMSYASVEQNSINFVTHTLRPYIAKMEDAYSALLPQGAFIRFNVDGLLRGDFATRMNGYSIGSQAGFYSVNDIRRFEDLRPVDGGDVYRVPLANVDLGAASLVETDKKVTMAQKLIASGFDPASVLSALTLPAIAHLGTQDVQSDISNTDANSEATAKTARELSIAEMVQKVYLGVGKIITSDEAREIVNSAGANLSIPGPKFSPPTPDQQRTLAQIAPTDPASVYEVKSQNLDINLPEVVLNYTPPTINVPAQVVNIPETVVNVNMPTSRAMIRTVEYGDDNKILKVIDTPVDEA